ncbi:MAG: hypothetical protein HY314_16170 [Acidobacteria bacterium]|nr:hypothetical protein [Acidobacteriota bacterium]
MIRRTTLVLALVVFALLSAFNVPISRGQSSPSFVGTWKLTLDFSPGPVFTYGVVARESKGFKPEDFLGPQANPNIGDGLVIGPCELGPSGKANGLTWRHTPKAGSPATGVELVFTTTSRSSPSSTIIRGPFSADGNRIEGKAIVVGDNTDPATVTPPNVFDSTIGRDVTLIPFVLERMEQVQCNAITIP